MSETPSSSLPPASQPPPPSSAEPPQSSSEATVVPKLEPDTSDASVLDAADMANNNTTSANAEAGAATAGAGDAAAAIGNPVQPTVVSVDAAASSKKETSLREFLGKMDEYAPIVCFSFSLFRVPQLLHPLSCLSLLHPTPSPTTDTKPSLTNHST
ncbi:hypothetical protein BJX63DRAFT_378912 [Aspergillus granulosus]|uniref:Uncharacterized protein n=1 Tax=Aspergillus granulosus TaxID=176169 RepID=A0ABR4I1V8_9EURO